MAVYVCPKCGEAGSVNAARPSIDDRYAIGTCRLTCKGVKQLVIRELYRAPKKVR